MELVNIKRFNSLIVSFLLVLSRINHNHSNSPLQKSTEKQTSIIQVESVVYQLRGRWPMDTSLTVQYEI